MPLCARFNRRERQAAAMLGETLGDTLWLSLTQWWKPAQVSTAAAASGEPAAICGAGRGAPP
jgi:hypothetical protein